jgi:amidase
MSADNLPIGAHFSAAKGEERTLLELAYELEFARPWAARKPPVWAG